MVSIFQGWRDEDPNPPPQWGASSSHSEIFYFNEPKEVSPDELESGYSQKIFPLNPAQKLEEPGWRCLLREFLLRTWEWGGK